MELRNRDGLTEPEFLKNYHAREYPRPSLTADVIVFANGAGGLEVLLIRRKNHPCIGMWALPGGFVNPNESAMQAALRELKEETGVSGLAVAELGLFSDPGRDPRTWVVSDVFFTLTDRAAVHAKAGDDAADAAWFRIDWAKDTATSCWKLVLRGASGQLDASFTFSRSSVGQFCDTKITQAESHGLAFDHAKMIALALRRLLGQN